MQAPIFRTFESPSKAYLLKKPIKWHEGNPILYYHSNNPSFAFRVLRPKYSKNGERTDKLRHFLLPFFLTAVRDKASLKSI